MKLKHTLFLGLSAFVYVGGGLQSALADDTEIYVTRDLPADQRIRPNLMFLIDTSGSMLSSVPGTNCKSLNYNGTNTVPLNWCTNKDKTKGTKTRVQVVKEVVNSLVDELAASNDVNIGLARFDSDSNGGFINIPMQRAGDVATAFKSSLSTYYADGGTPLLESYYETYLYMSGGTPNYGLNSEGYIENRLDSKLVNPWKSDSASMTGGKYKSPIQYSCQKSNIIVLTDGLPSNDTGSNTAVKNLVSSVNQTYKACKNYPTDDNGTTSGCWMPGLAEYMANQDVSSSQTGKQTVNTYTIGFGNISDTRLLQDSADLGGGRFFTTSNTSELAEALRSIAVDILAENTTFATPSVSVSAYNNLGYRNDLYYALFRPAEGARWFGNIKKYKLGKDTAGNSIVMDSNGNNAVDSSTGFFNATSLSYWSTVTDGKDVKLGGAAGRLTTPSTRKVLTYTGQERTPGLSDSAALATFATSNTDITKPLLGLATSASDQSRTDTINWGLGINPSDGTARLALADILHSEPKLVAYVTDEDLQRVANSQAKPPTATSTEKLVLFYGTNEGFINAVDPATGTEIFSFIPKELLPNLNYYLNDPKGTAMKRYGMDGQFDMSITYGALNSSSLTRTVTKATLYAGMRRGGRNYYALDVTPSSTGSPVAITPKLKWVIKGGTSTGFEKLGQTWSTPKLAKVKFNGAIKNVLIFTGGYDTNQDTESPNTPTSDSVGNALYMVDADTGSLLWHAGASNETSANLKIATLTNSIPADPTLVDITGDGLIDAIFMADTRGQVFRIDLNSGNAGSSNFASGGRIAALGGGTAAENRRFYNAPDVSLIRERGGKTYFTIALGSGYREHPLNEDTIDRFYVLRDSNVYTVPSSYTTLTESNLVDVTSVNLTTQQAQQIQQNIDTKLGLIAQLNQATSTADSNFDSYKSTIGYTQKYNQLTQANSDATQRQAQIDAIYKENPFLDEHAPESALQSTLQNQMLTLQNALKQLYAFSPNTAQALGQQMAGVMIVQKTLENAATTIATQEQALLDAKASGAGDDSINALQTQLDQSRTAYQASTAYTQRGSLNGVDLTATLNSLSQAIQAKDTAAADAAVQAIAAQLGLTDVPTSVDVPMLNALDEASNASTLQGQASSQQGLLQLANDLESQRLTLAGQASTLQAELNALTAAPYNGASGLLTSTELQDATALDSSPPLTTFEAYDYLRNKARSNALTQIPVLRSDINSLYQQLSPGDSYTVNSDLLNASSGWFVRFPQGEKILAASISFQGAVLFTSFSPNGQTVTTCGPDVGHGRLYAMNLTDASAVFTKTVNGVETPSRTFDLVRGGIPPTPAIILGDGGTTVLVGSEKPSGDGNGGDLKCTFTSSGFCKSDRAVSGTYWREN